MSAAYGSYCTSVKQVCLKWMEPPPDPEEGRCLKFAPSTCGGPRKDLRFCIDTDEYTAPGDKLPLAQTSWTDAKRICEGRGRRLCLESEWNFACEGGDMLPYPTGLERPIGRCNFDQLKLLDDRGAVRDLRKRSRSLDECISPFGVRNMAGNVDEWTMRDVTNGPNRSALKGGWWMAARNRCRPATTAHGEHFRDFETGIRCCADAG
jgi:formylglycine-generating enzyme